MTVDILKALGISNGQDVVKRQQRLAEVDAELATQRFRGASVTTPRPPSSPVVGTSSKLSFATTHCVHLIRNWSAPPSSKRSLRLGSRPGSTRALKCWR